MDNNDILEYAQKTGCDIDGDVIYIEGRAVLRSYNERNC